jgi:hypothetical protein
MTMRNRNGQDGVAMITVMMIVVVLSLLMVASLNYALQGEPPSRRDQDWNAALAAAQAGVDDYLYRLQQDQDYLQYSATNPPTPANVAFTGWHNIPGPSNLGQFHYSVSNVTSQGIVQVVSTGRVRSVQRTVRANLRRRGFLDYLYLTDYESLDPQSGYYSDPDDRHLAVQRVLVAGPVDQLLRAHQLGHRRHHQRPAAHQRHHQRQRQPPLQRQGHHRLHRGDELHRLGQLHLALVRPVGLQRPAGIPDRRPRGGADSSPAVD